MTSTVDATRRGLRVLVVIRSSASTVSRRLRRSLQSAGVTLADVTIVSGAEIACVDGVNAVEAVLVRRLRTGRLVGFNASSLLTFAACTQRVTFFSTRLSGRAIAQIRRRS